MEEFKRGDVVVLKSGGPKMTIEIVQYNNSTDVKCAWFIGDEVKTHIFQSEALDKVED